MSDVRDYTNPLSKEAIKYIRSAKANVVSGMQILEELQDSDAETLSPAGFEMLNEACLTLSNVLDTFDSE